MGANKQQHYVPQFYLRRFSPYANGRTINVFNLKREKYIQNASLKHQASGVYFYGRANTLERTLAVHEGEVSEITARIITEGRLPSPGTSEYISLVTFILFLRARTERAAEEVDALFDTHFKILASKDPRIQTQADKHRIRARVPSLVSVGTMASITFVAADLGCVLVENQTPTKFLTSDNPVFFDNRYMEKKRAHGSQTGIASRGLRVFWPLSPDYLLLLFDPDVYQVCRKRTGSIRADREYDIWGLNRLQFVGAHRNVFCSDHFTEAQLHDYHRKSQGFRSEDLQVINEYVAVDNSSRSLFEFGRQDPKCGLDLSFIRITKRARAAPLTGPVAQVRNPALCRAIAEFDDLVEKGVYSMGQFGDFLEQRTGKSE